MSATEAIPPALPTGRRTAMRRSILLAILACLFFHFLLFSGYFGFIEQLFPSYDEFVVVGLLVETMVVFVILYRAPLLSVTQGKLPNTARAGGLIVLAHCLVWGVMLSVAVLWFVTCAGLGIPPRGDI